MVYDITKESTFDSIEKWHTKLMESADDKIVMMVCGNKSDLTGERAVSSE